MTTSVPFSANQEAAMHLGFVDEWTQATRYPQVRDALLDLRRAYLDARRRPLLAVKKFLKLRVFLRQRSYLHEHRLRTALQSQIEVEITTPTACWCEPLDLTWPTIQRVLDAPRHRAFEQSLAAWDDIRVRLVAKNPQSAHGKNSL